VEGVAPRPGIPAGNVPASVGYNDEGAGGTRRGEGEGGGEGHAKIIGEGVRRGAEEVEQLRASGGGGGEEDEAEEGLAVHVG
jgi:hypothetical protein